MTFSDFEHFCSKMDDLTTAKISDLPIAKILSRGIGCNAKFLRGMFEVPECDVFLCTGSSGDRKNAKFDQFGQERRNFGVLGLVTKVMQV